MSKNKTGTYQLAKDVYNSLSVNEKVFYTLDKFRSRIFRKHLSEMTKRKKTANKYVTRFDGKNIMIMRIE